MGVFLKSMRFLCRREGTICFACLAMLAIAVVVQGDLTSSSDKEAVLSAHFTGHKLPGASVPPPLGRASPARTLLHRATPGPAPSPTPCPTNHPDKITVCPCNAGKVTEQGCYEDCMDTLWHGVKFSDYGVNVGGFTEFLECKCAAHCPSNGLKLLYNKKYSLNWKIDDKNKQMDLEWIGSDSGTANIPVMYKKFDVCFDFNSEIKGRISRALVDVHCVNEACTNGQVDSTKFNTCTTKHALEYRDKLGESASSLTCKMKEYQRRADKAAKALEHWRRKVVSTKQLLSEIAAKY